VISPNSGRCVRAVRVRFAACADSRPAGSTRPTINQQSVDAERQPVTNNGSSEADSLCSVEQMEDDVEGKRAATRTNPDDRRRCDRNNGERKLRSLSLVRPEQNAVRAAWHGPERPPDFPSVELVRSPPTRRPTVVRTATVVVGRHGPAVGLGVWACQRHTGATPVKPVQTLREVVESHRRGC